MSQPWRISMSGFYCCPQTVKMTFHPSFTYASGEIAARTYRSLWDELWNLCSIFWLYVNRQKEKTCLQWLSDKEKQMRVH